MHQSIATIDAPQFINLQPLDINPLMSSCEIKVLYVGENRNHSYITEEVASEMAKTLRGAPIVGYYKEEKEDFADHGEQVIFDDEGIHFNCLTKPFGFVAPDAKVWFQNFEDTDDFGNIVTRKYMMTTGYLWTEQYEECKKVIEEGRPQSMELDENTLKGNWSTNNKTGMDFFIINDAIFSKLCILGDDVEPCFEGASVTSPQVSNSFSKVDNNFRHTLFTMMQELKFALEGGHNMENEEKVTTDIEATGEAIADETVEEAKVEENFSTENDNSDKSVVTENQDSIESNFSEEEIKEEDSTTVEVETETEEEDVSIEEKYSLLNEELENLKIEHSNLRDEYEKLVEFKLQVEEEKKDSLIKSFYMLSDEDKAEVIENKSKYTLDEIEAKLSIICVKKKVNFDKEDEVAKENDSSITTYTVQNTENLVPAWISALRHTKNSRECEK